MIWGSTFVVVKEALDLASPLPFLAVRFALAGALLALVFRGGASDPAALRPALALGAFLFGGYAFQTWGLLHTTPSKCAFITGFGVILVPLLQVFWGFVLTRGTVLGAALGLGGIYLLVLPSGLAAVNRGDLLTLIGSLSFAMHIVLVGKYTQRHEFRRLVPPQILAVSALAFLALPFDSHLRWEWAPGLVGALLITALLATAFAFSIQNWAQKFTPPAHTALIFALEPVFAAITSRLVLDERLGGKALLGAALVLAGMVISELWGAGPPRPVES